MPSTVLTEVQREAARKTGADDAHKLGSYTTCAARRRDKMSSCVHAFQSVKRLVIAWLRVRFRPRRFVNAAPYRGPSSMGR